MDHNDTNQQAIAEVEALRRELAECKRQLAKSRGGNAFSFFSDAIKTDPIAFVSPEYVYLNVNRAFEEFWGRSRSEVIGTPVERLLGREAFKRVRPNMDRALAGETLDFDGWFEKAADGPRFVKLTCQPFFDAEGRIAGVINIGRDLTDYKKAMDSLRESRERLGILFGKASDAMFVADMDGILIRVNDQAVRSTGYARSELLGMNMADLDAGLRGDLLAFKEMVAKLPEAGPVLFASRYVRKDGSRIPVELTGCRLELLGEPVVLCIARDLSESRAREIKYGQILRTAIDGFWVVDRAGCILEANRAAGKMHGRDHKAMTGLSIGLIGGVRAADDWRRHLARVAKSGKDTFETRHELKSGGFVDVEASTSCVPLKGGRFVSFIRDITGRRHMERERELSLGLMKRINRPSTMEELLSDITGLMMEWSGCEAVAIRLRRGGDYPFVETLGFPDGFFAQGNRLCRTGPEGKLPRDDAGNPAPECMCGKVIRAGLDPSQPCVTAGGSFWTNSAGDLPACDGKEGGLPHAGDRCLACGYESVALVPLRHGEDTLGLLQFCHSARDHFDLNSIELFERLAESLAVGLIQRRSTEKLVANRAKYRSLYNSMAEMFVLHRLIYRQGKAVDYEIIDCNTAFCRITGISRETAIGSLASELYGSGEPPYLDTYVRTAETGEPAYFESYFEPMGKHFSISVFSSEKGEFGTVSLDITAHKQKEEALRVSEERLELALDSVRDAVWDWRTDTGETYFSSRCFTMLGYGPDELPSCYGTWRDLVHPDDLHQAESTVARHLESGEPFEMELRMRTRDGNWRWLLDRGRLIERDENGNPVRMLGTYVDITERKRNEEALRKNEAMMRSVFRVSPIGIGVVRDRVIAEVNDRFCEMTGYARDELMGQSSRMLYPTREEFDMVGGVIRCAQSEKAGIGSLETRMMRKDGSIMDVLVSSTPLEPGDDSAGVTFTALDITERKKAEQDLKTSHEVMLSIMDGIEATIYVSDMETHEILFMNKRMVEDFGGDCTGLVCHEVLRGRSEPCEHCVNHLLLDASGRPSGVYTWEDYNLVSGKWYMNHDRAIRWQGGKMVRLQIAIDISELKNSQREKNKLESQLALVQKMDALGTLAGGIAHDFNNILATIMGYSELIQDDLEQGDPMREDMGEIVQAAIRGKDLVRRILTFSRKAEVNQKPISLSKSVEDAAGMLKRVIPKMIRLDLDLDRGLRPVKANARQMEQIVFNLVSNASDAIDGEGAVGIATKNVLLSEMVCDTCGARISGEHVMLSIKDDGAGMTPETKANMLDPFFTTKGVGKGTGLGLSTVYGILTSHNGHLACHTRPGEGTEFIIYLPVADEAAIDADEAEAAAADGPGGSETILLVDDERAIRKVAGRTLANSGYTVFKAQSGEEALEILEREKERIQGVVLDLGMPGMGGKECLPKILEINPRARVMVASGYIQYENSSELEELGAMVMVPKPYRKQELLERVRWMLDADPGR